MILPSPVRRRRAAAVLAVAGVVLLTACSTTGGDTGPVGRLSAAGSAPPSSTATDEPGSVDGLDDTVALGTAREDVFSVQSPWNTEVTTAPIASDSATLLANSTLRTVVGLDGRARTEAVQTGVQIMTRTWTVPVVADGAPTVVTCRQVRCGDGSGDITLDIPTDLDPDPLHDGWFTVFEPSTGIAYDLWRARREADGTISYHYLRTWELDGPGFSQPYVAGARGSGLPLFGGLIRPGELERCSINHALAIGIPGPAAGYFVQPASWTDGTNQADSLPEGARIRLRSDVRVQPPVDPLTGAPLPFTRARRTAAACIVDALQTYGAIVVDRADVPTLYFQRLAPQKGRRPLLNGYELSSLGLDDFEVVDFSDDERFVFPPSVEGGR